MYRFHKWRSICIWSNHLHSHSHIDNSIKWTYHLTFTYMSMYETHNLHEAYMHIISCCPQKCIFLFFLFQVELHRFCRLSWFKKEYIETTEYFFFLEYVPTPSEHNPTNHQLYWSLTNSFSWCLLGLHLHLRKARFDLTYIDLWNRYIKAIGTLVRRQSQKLL